MDPADFQTGTWYADEPFFIGGASGTMRWGDSVLRNARGVNFFGNWGSSHPSGAEFLFADASVRMIPYQSHSPIVAALLTPNGGEAAVEY
jgi:hypothetical protein